MSKQLNRGLLFFLFLLFLNIFLANFLIIYLPGEVIALQAETGEGFYLATVAIGDANLWRALYGVFAPEASLTYGDSDYIKDVGDFSESLAIANMVVADYLDCEQELNSPMLPDNILGNSGGLLLALAYYAENMSINLASGLRISGSGTLTKEGLIQPVQGVKQKVIAADQHQIDIFFVHPDNFIQAQAIETEMRLVQVSSFSEALRFLLDTNRQSLYNL